MDRFTDSLRRLNSGTLAKREPDRAEKPERWGSFWWKTIIRGGVRSIETTYSGKESGARYSGFHVHAHMVLELHDPPQWWVVQHYGDACPRFPMAPDVWKLVCEEWRLFAMDRLVECWRTVSPIHESQAQEKKIYRETGIVMDGCHVDLADREKVYQACKYATKPEKLTESELSDADVGDHADSRFWALVELLTAVQDRKTKSAWGTWRDWREASREKLEAKRAEDAEAELQEANAEPGESEAVDGELVINPEQWVPVTGDLGTLVDAAQAGGMVVTRPRRGESCMRLDASRLLGMIAQRLKLSPLKLEKNEVKRSYNMLRVDA